MSTLQGKIISNSYKELLKIAEVSANQGVSASLVRVQTGDGTNTALQVATGQVYVGGTFGTGNDVSVSGDLLVTGKVCASSYYGDGSNLSGVTATIEGNVSITNLTVGGTASVSGATVLKSTVTVEGAGTFKSNVSVSGNVNIGGTVTIAGTNVQAANAKVCASAFYGDGSNLTNVPTSGDVSVSTLRVTHNASIGGTLSVVGAVGLNSTLSVSGATHLQSTVSIAGATTIGGATNLLSTATVSGAAGFLGTVRVSGATSLASTLDVAGNVSLGGNVTVKGDVHVSSKVCASAFYGDGSNLTNVPAN